MADESPTPQDAAMAELRDATEAERAAYNALIAAQTRLYAARDAVAKYAQQGTITDKTGAVGITG